MIVSMSARSGANGQPHSIQIAALSSIGKPNTFWKSIAVDKSFTILEARRARVKEFIRGKNFAAELLLLCFQQKIKECPAKGGMALAFQQDDGEAPFDLDARARGDKPALLRQLAMD